jgi:hypothetical protein
MSASRRTRQLDTPRPPAALHPPVERLQPEEVQPAGGVGALLRLLQLRPVPQVGPHDARDEGRDYPEALESSGPPPGGDGEPAGGGVRGRIGGASAPATHYDPTTLDRASPGRGFLSPGRGRL